MRPLRIIAKAITDELKIENPIIKKWIRKLIFLFLPYPKPTQVRKLSILRRRAKSC